MQGAIYNLTAELVSLVVITIGAGVMTFVGLISNQNGLSELLSGGMVLGMWYLAVGGITLYAGIYLLGYQEINPRINQLLHRGDKVPE